MLFGVVNPTEIAMIHRLKAVALAVSLWFVSAAALAQTSPNWPYGYVPTTAEWNTFLASKADYTGSPNITSAGGTFTGKVNFASSSAGTAAMNCGVGTAPASPVNGDLWCTTAGVFARINGSTIALGSSGGTLAVTAGGTGQASFTANLPILGNGTSALAQGTRSGNTTVFGTITGATTSGDCLSYDASGNIHSAGVGACGGTGGAGTVASASAGQLAIYTAATTVSGLAGCNNGYFGTNGGGTVSCITTLNTTLSGTITALGTIATGVWQGTPVSGQYGGTGVANTGLTITLAGNLVTSGANSLTLTTIGATNVTLPTSGSLMNTNGTSGGIPYYNSSTTVQSSGALTANMPVFGGGAGSSPFAGTRTGNTTEVVTYAGAAPTSTRCAEWDSSGNLTASSSVCAGSAPSAVLLATISGGGTNYTDTTHFTSTYTSYTIIIEQLIPSSATLANNNCIIQVTVGGTPQTSSYATGITPLGGGTGSTPAFGIPCSIQGISQPVNSGIGVSGTIQLFQPNFGSSGKAMFTGITAYQQTNACGAGCPVAAGLAGFLNVANTVNGITIGFTNNAGAFTSSGIASGTVKIYGNS